MLILSIILLLLSTAVNNRRDSSILYSRITILVLINTLIILYINYNSSFIHNGLIIYGGLMLIKNYTMIFISFILILSIFIIGINSFLPNKFMEGNIKYISNKKMGIFVNKMADQYRIIEYPLIILFCLTGAVFLMSSSDIVSVFLSLELQSYGLYLICSIYRNSESSISAGLTYFLLGGLSSCIILLGISLLYINTGNTNLENIYMINSISNAYTHNIIYENIQDHTNNMWIYKYVYMQYTYMQLPLTIISVGLLFKIAAAPFHFWSPDVYDAIPTIVTTFVAIIAKVSLLILLLELILYTEDNILTYSWSNNIIISSILSLFIGSVLGLVQHRIKRLYAYSTISHVGFILLALSVNTLESTRAFFFYIIQYSLSNLNAFIILISIGYSLYFYYHKQDFYVKNSVYSPIQYISQLKGYFYINPVIAISLGITLFSFIGIPPLVGFFGKQMILSNALDNGYLFTTLIAILTSVISAVYYLVIVKVIFFDKEEYKFDYHMFFNISDKLSINDIDNLKSKSISSYLSLSISVLTLLILSFMFYDQEIIRLLYTL
jgi:NADH-ubiquinone oxidoreductase chain 2